MSELRTPWYAHYNGGKKRFQYPKGSISQVLWDSAMCHPDYISYSYFGAETTYREFLTQIEACAEAFLAMGYKKGDVISICMPNTPEAIISFYAINRIGAIANMIHPLSSEREIRQFLKGANSKCIIIVDVEAKKVRDMISEGIVEHAIVVSPADSMPLFVKVGYTLSRIRKEKPDVLGLIPWDKWIEKGAGNHMLSSVQDGRANDVAVILYSGGTSGIPKGICLTNLNFNALAMQGFDACGCLEEKDRVLAIMPIFHGFGLGTCVHTVQYFGGTSILLPSFRADKFDQLIRKYRPNVVAGVPTLFEALLKNTNFAGMDLSFLKCVISGGDSLSISLKRKIDAFLKAHNANIQVREGYGLTECVTGCCMMPEHSFVEGSIGIPYPDTLIKIVNPESMEEMPYGEDGEIVLSGPTVMKGYLNCEGETAEVLRKHEDGRTWLHTGDVGCMDENGFIYFKQRLKRVIMSSGYSVYPKYIENAIESHPQVIKSCVIGIPHPYKMQVPKAYIVIEGHGQPSDELREDIKAHCEKLLAKYQWPAEYEYLRILPKTLVGKVAYKKLEKPPVEEETEILIVDEE